MDIVKDAWEGVPDLRKEMHDKLAGLRLEYRLIRMRLERLERLVGDDVREMTEEGNNVA